MRQKQALRVMLEGNSVFLTGAPGAGKTHTIRDFIKLSTKQGKVVAVTASTGIAATHIGGSTIHSWAKIGIRDVLSPKELSILVNNSTLFKKINSTDILIIDEISMLHGIRLDMVDQICQRIRGSDKPFGGLQVIFVGDLYQLPPVNRQSQIIDFAHTSQAWQQLNPLICYLSEQHRQKNDELLDLLQAMRSRNLLTRHIRLLQDRMAIKVKDNQQITKLYTHNIDVDSMNQKRLDALDSPSQFYEMTYKGSASKQEQLIRSILAPESLELKIGAEVMFVANDSSRKFSNGSRGTVVGFDENNHNPIVKMASNGRQLNVESHTWQLTEDGKIKAEVSQLPLRLAWAITIHKSQGMSLDAAEMDLSKSFTPGMGYVALSRVRSINGVYLKGINKIALLLHDDIHLFDDQLLLASNQLSQSVEDITDEIINEKHVQEFDNDLFHKLVNWRKIRAQNDNVPPFIVAHDSLLKEISRHKPKNQRELLTIKGMGPKKLELYKQDILRITR